MTNRSCSFLYEETGGAFIKYSLIVAVLAVVLLEGASSAGLYTNPYWHGFSQSVKGVFSSLGEAIGI